MHFQTAIAFCLFAAVCASYIPQHHEEHHHPEPYKFGYEVKDHEGSQYRNEEGDGHGQVRGSYGYVDHKGIHRHVDYVADHHGFRAHIKTNEPGTANQDPASVKIHSSASQHPHHEPVYHPQVY